MRIRIRYEKWRIPNPLTHRPIDGANTKIEVGTADGTEWAELAHSGLAMHPQTGQSGWECQVQRMKGLVDRIRDFPGLKISNLLEVRGAGVVDIEPAPVNVLDVIGRIAEAAEEAGLQNLVDGLRGISRRLSEVAHLPNMRSALEERGLACEEPTP